MSKMSAFEIFNEWVRVVKLSRKPRRDEFTTIAKITGFGMLLIGVIGFITSMIIFVLF